MQVGEIWSFELTRKNRVRENTIEKVHTSTTIILKLLFLHYTKGLQLTFFEVLFSSFLLSLLFFPQELNNFFCTLFYLNTGHEIGQNMCSNGPNKNWNFCLSLDYEIFSLSVLSPSLSKKIKPWNNFVYIAQSIKNTKI